MKGIFLIKSFNSLKRFILPKSTKDDLSRKEFILNILIISAVVIISSAIIVYIFILFSRPQDLRLEDALPLSLIVAILIFFGLLYFLSRKGFFRLASYLLLGIFFLLTFHMAYRWGIEVQAVLLFCTLIIVMSGILISTRFAFISTGLLIMMLTVVNYLQRQSIIIPNRYWSSELAGIADLVMFSIIFSVIATVSWLSNREIEKSLVRARKSEADLKDERDSLEMKVEQRTKELKEVQAEKMIQLYRFAEFGRISSGLFHDLINPLNAVSLNLGKTDGTAEETRQYVGNAVRAAKKLEDLVVAVRKQLAREETKTLFLVEEEIKCVIEVLSHKAQKANVKLRFIPRSSVQMFGDAVKFNQVVLNLVVNGIDACVPPTAELVPLSPGDRWVQVFLIEEPEAISMLVEDNGVGIPEHHMDKIFEPFFTTKKSGQGIGIGLSMSKRIVEKDFGGSLIAKSEGGRGSSFRVLLPIRKQVTEYA